MTQSTQIFPHSSEDARSWQSISMIPVARYLLQKKLEHLEAHGNQNNEKSEQLSREEIQGYWEKSQYWNQADLNSKQKEWMQDIHFYLSSLQQTLFKSPSQNVSPPVSTANSNPLNLSL